MADEDARKLFVAGLSDSVTEDVLREMFSATGASQVDVNVPRDRATGRPRGFAFVTLGSADEAANARKLLDGSLQAGRSIAVRPFRADGPGREERGPSGGPSGDGSSSEERTLYVRNLPYESTRDEVAEMFKAQGIEDVERVHLPVGPDGKGKGFGFVTLRSASSAQGAIGALRNATLRGRPIAANIARGREERDRERATGGGAGGPPPMREPPVVRGGVESGRRERRFDNQTEAPPEDEEGRRLASRKDKKGKKKTTNDNPRDRRKRDEGMKSPRSWQQIDDWDDD